MIAEADAALFRLINHGYNSPGLDQLMLLATTAGTGIVQSGFSLFLIFFGFLANKVDWRRAGYAGIIALALSGSAVQLAKVIWNRPRPLLQIFDVRVVGEPLFTHSFPSGHSMTAFAVAIACSVFVPRLRYLLIPVAVLTAISRIYVGAHFPLDVAYGALAGTLIGIWCGRLVRNYALRDSEKRETAAG